MDPLPNLYFTRDPFATIGTGVSIHRMHTATRNRETLFGKFIFEHHPDYRNAPRWYDRGETSSLEGGDILVLSPQVLAVGISQRTQEDSIDALAETVLSQSKTFRKLLAFNIPKTRSFMHLDTVFTMVDRDKFTVHPNILRQITVFVMELDENRKMKIRQEDGRLEDILKEHLEPGPRDPDPLRRRAARSTPPGNSGATAPTRWPSPPGEVVVYSRNYVTNRSLEEAGVRHPHHPQRGAEPGPGRPPVHDHAPVEGGAPKGRASLSTNNELKEKFIMAVNLKGRSFLTLADFTPAEIRYLLDLARDLKAKRRSGVCEPTMQGKHIVLLFEKTSTRTRCSFEVAATQEGAHVTYLDAGSSQMGKKESLEDSAKVLGRFFDGIEYRGFDQKVVEDLAKVSPAYPCGTA